MAFNVITTIDLDMARPNVSIVNAVQYDSSGRVVKARLFNNGVAWQVPYGVIPVIRYQKSDRIGGFYDTDENGAYAISYENNRTIVNITLALQALTAAGTVNVQINFYNSSGIRVTSFAFRVNVQASAIPDGQIVSSEYYNALTATIAEAASIASLPEAIARTEAAAEEAENAAEEAENAALIASSAASREVASQVAPLVTSWLSTNITNPSNPPLDRSLTSYSGAAPANSVGAIKSGIDYANDRYFFHGSNYFNYSTIEKGYVIKRDNTISVVGTGYTSDFIEVKPSTVYNKRYTFRSSDIADVVFYDAGKGFISAFYNSSNNYFTTPSTCKYIRICGYISNAGSEWIFEGSSSSEHAPYKEILRQSSGGADRAYFYSNYPLVFDAANSQLVSTASNMTTAYLHIPGLKFKPFSLPIQVTGSGNFLYYSLTNNNFVRSNTDIVDDKDVYRIASMAGRTSIDMRAYSDSLFIVSTSPVLRFDIANRVLHVNIPATSYLWYGFGFSAMQVESYDLELRASGITCIWFDTVTHKFEVSSDFEDHLSKPSFLQVGFVYNTRVQCIIPYSNISGGSFEGKTITTYGDSLTWYDGKEFTWGEHQGEICVGFQSYIRDKLGATVVNKGTGGSTTPQIVENTIKTDSSQIRSSDYIIFMPSIDNDDRLNVSPGTVQPIGGTFDTTTTAGAIQSAIEYIYSVNSTARVILMVEPKGWNYVNNAPKLCNELLVTAVRNVAKQYSIPCIDLWEKSGLNELTRNIYLADPTFESGDNRSYMYHPNNFGWEVISRTICEELKNY